MSSSIQGSTNQGVAGFLRTIQDAGNNTIRQSFASRIRGSELTGEAIESLVSESRRGMQTGRVVDSQGVDRYRAIMDMAEADTNSQKQGTPTQQEANQPKLENASTSGLKLF